MADIPPVSPQLLTPRAADDPICRVTEIITEIPHALSEAIVPELPESDRPSVIAHRIPLPPALEPGVCQRARDPGIRPARSPEVPLDIAGIPRADPHPIGHLACDRAWVRWDGPFGGDVRGHDDEGDEEHGC